jgi:beta-lactamase class A
VTSFARSLGDPITRLDRNEPTLNDPGRPGDLRDTTTPSAMAGLWRRILSGAALSPASHRHLMDWLGACETGPNRLKAATPKGWRIGHKTGTGPTTIGDVAIVSPPNAPPIIIAVYLDAGAPLKTPRDDTIAAAGRLALKALQSAHG